MVHCVVDLAPLQRLAALPGRDGQSLVSELIASLAGRMPALLDEMRHLQQRGDGDGLRRSAHSIRGAALQFGATTLAEAARTLEMVAESGAVETAAALIDHVAAVWAPTEVALRSACGPATPLTPPPAPPPAT
jgi:HPt (histidine-containing phosphotransfer) domain-containing protein